MAQSRSIPRPPPAPTMQDFWQSSGFTLLERNAAGWLKPTAAYVGKLLSREELAIVAESCDAERTLHAALQADPLRDVTAADLANIRDADARENYAVFLKFRDALLAAGTLEGWYLATFQRGVIDVPPLFIDLVAHAVLRNVLDGEEDVYQLRAGELLFRRQRISTEEGHILSADADTIELYAETGGFGNLGRLIAQNNTPLPTMQLDVLTHETAQLYLLSDERFKYVLDLSQGRPGLDALAKVLERWVAHFLGVAVTVTPLQKVEDDTWRWHVGLDIESSAILNALYAGEDVPEERQQRLVSLFTLTFANADDMRADVSGKPVYLGLAINEDNVLKLKPQNLLVNLPLATRS